MPGLPNNRIVYYGASEPRVSLAKPSAVRAVCCSFEAALGEIAWSVMPTCS